MILALMTPFIEETVGTATLLHLAAIITLIDNIISVTCIVVVMIGLLLIQGPEAGCTALEATKALSSWQARSQISSFSWPNGTLKWTTLRPNWQRLLQPTGLNPHHRWTATMLR